MSILYDIYINIQRAFIIQIRIRVDGWSNIICNSILTHNYNQRDCILAVSFVGTKLSFDQMFEGSSVVGDKVV